MTEASACRALSVVLGWVVLYVAFVSFVLALPIPCGVTQAVIAGGKGRNPRTTFSSSAGFRLAPSSRERNSHLKFAATRGHSSSVTAFCTLPTGADTSTVWGLRGSAPGVLFLTPSAASSNDGGFAVQVSFHKEVCFFVIILRVQRLILIVSFSFYIVFSFSCLLCLIFVCLFYCLGPALTLSFQVNTWRLILNECPALA